MRRKKDVYYADVVYVLYSVDRLIGILSQTLQQGNALLSFPLLLFTLVMNECPLLSLSGFLPLRR